jgi:hypothetical protein
VVQQGDALFPLVADDPAPTVDLQDGRVLLGHVLGAVDVELQFPPASPRVGDVLLPHDAPPAEVEGEQDPGEGDLLPVTLLVHAAQSSPYPLGGPAAVTHDHQQPDP